jgi:Tol biopolymer transport system component
MKRILTALTISLLSVASDSVQSADAPTIASAPEQVSRTASGNSLIPTFSGNGKVLVFASSAKNIATNEDKSLNLQLFRFDLPAGGTALISINQNNEPANAEAASVAISSNANQIVFASRANNLVPNDTNQASDIFLWEASNSNPRLVSVAVDGTSSAANPSPLASRPLSENPKLSEHGRRVVFESYSTNLVANPKDPARRDIFARDLSSNITTLVSINTNGTGANADVRLPVVSPDGRFVSFVSSATDLVPVEIPHGEHLFVRDLENGTTTWLSRDLLTMGEYTNTPPGYRFVDHAMSADGKIFAYKITHPSTPQVWVYRYDLNEDATLLLSLGSFDRSAPQLSPDGRFTAYEDGSSIYVWDQLLNSNILVTVSSTGSTPANGVSQTPALSRDGRYVAFVSSASDLVMNTANGLFQVFLRDLQSGTTRLLSRSTNGVAANAGHEFVVPALAPDGSSVAFESDATNLVDNDGNNSSDIFLYDVSTETLRVVSESNSAKPATSRPQPSGIVRGALSADGAWLAFFGYPVSEPTNKHSDLFIRNLATGTNVDISLVTNSVSNAEISADGRYAIVNRRLGGVSAAD